MHHATKPTGGGDLLVEFAAALRRLRQRAGSPSYQRMSSCTYYSVSTLCRADKGTTFPTKPVVLAYVDACSGYKAFWNDQYESVKHALEDGTTVKLSPWPGFDGPDPEHTPRFGTVPRLDEDTSCEDEDFLKLHGRQYGEILRIEHEYIYGSREETGWMEAYVKLLEIAAGRHGAPIEATSDTTEYAEEMQRIRRNSGLSLAEIASRTARLSATEDDEPERVGLSKSTISDLCNPACGRLPSPRSVRLFLEALGAAPDDIAYWLRIRDNITHSHLLRVQD
jgi:transcriptional regulator with XRE-family HTH domain